MWSVEHLEDWAAQSKFSQLDVRPRANLLVDLDFSEVCGNQEEKEEKHTTS